MENDGGGGKGTGDVHHEEGESGAKRIKCSIEVAAFRCDNCKIPLSRPPICIFQCPGGHFFCSSCRDYSCLPKDTCAFDGDRCNDGNLARSLGMERAVESILVDCPYAKHGCTKKTTLFCLARHWPVCPHAPCQCPEPGCNFAGKSGDLLDHFTAGGGHHKWPSTTFQYWVSFGLRIVEPGTQVLRCKSDGQLFLVSVQAATEPPGLAVSLIYVEHLKTNATRTGYRCSVSFSYSARHRGTSTWVLRSSLGSPPRPTCVFLPNKVSDGPDEAGIVLRVNISCIEAVDDEDDLDYVEGDEDMSVSDEDDRGNS